MKRASYRAAIEWIARNDEALETELEPTRTLISVALVADLFDVADEVVAQEVLRKRAKLFPELFAKKED